jgi:uncharacterized tellurite resistance protein B-like protein
MLSFFKKAPRDTGTLLERSIRANLVDADEDTMQTVVAVAGLLVRVAFEDEHFSPDEEARIRKELRRVASLGESGIDAIVRVMRDHTSVIATVEAADYARWLGEKKDRPFRLAVLQLLVDVAAAHEGISDVELDGVGRIALDLKLDADELAALLPR